jgi:hypothetical protein
VPVKTNNPEAAEPVGDFRSAPMPTPEGAGKAKQRFQKAWEAYANALRPVSEPMARVIGRELTFDLMGFWLTWQLHGGFEGMQRDLKMSRSAVYRRVSAFRRATGMHPDEFSLPGVTLNTAKYVAGQPHIASITVP